MSRDPGESLSRPAVTEKPETRRLILTGRVQGVGFRPFVYRLAHQHALSGWVKNASGQVEILVHGSATRLDAFEQDLLHRHPPLARPILSEKTPLCPEPDNGDFRILPSDDIARADIHIPPDLFCCNDCLQELLDPNARRYRYPFINCTQCGPRYTLIQTLPYDRANTSMRDFPLCRDCHSEYTDPLDRRFHAEPLACPVCGPELTFQQGDNRIVGNTPALKAAVEQLHQGKIVAVKGVGGYHLICDASNALAVQRLRRKKFRPHKPLAVLFPWTGDDGLDNLREHLRPTATEAMAVTHPDRPIVLIGRLPDGRLAPALAPGLNEIGAMLPYSPLHHLLAGDFGGPLVATSANLSGEPVITDPTEANSRLGAICDAFLHHNRPIVRPADDSLVRVIAGRPRRFRIGRGLAPLEMKLPTAIDEPVLAVGGHMKNTVALAWDDRVVLSPHIGDLDSPRSLAVFEQVIEDLSRLYRVTPRRVITDAHPGYTSTRWAHKQSGIRGWDPLPIYHHHAHAGLVAGEFAHESRWLVFAWDGTGLGPDGAIWGGEAFIGSAGDWQRVASLRPFRLPGGDKASREPWRSALALAWEEDARWKPTSIDTDILHEAWIRGINTPHSHSAGRVFDAISAFSGLSTQTSFEGQAPMLLEAAAERGEESQPLRLPLYDSDGLLLIDWAPLIPLSRNRRLSLNVRAHTAHAALARALIEQALTLRTRHGDFAVGLSGGVFQNRLLTERVMDGLQAGGFRVYLPEQVPYNDAGLAFGQVIEASLKGNN